MARPKNLLSPYKGDLAKPIIIPKAPKALSILSDDSQKAQYDDEVKKYNSEIPAIIFDEHLRKLELLEKHYKIKEKYPTFSNNQYLSMTMLCIELAKNHVEGFKIQTKNSSGRIKKWDVISHALLYWDVENKIAEKGHPSTHGIKWACKELLKTPYWSDFLSPKKNGGNKPKVLQDEYTKSKESSLVKLIIALQKDCGLSKEDVAQIFVEKLRTPPTNKQS